MNWIKKREMEHKAVKDEVKRIADMVNLFRRHLNSSKFHKDTTIQVSDVHNWLDIVEGKEDECGKQSRKPYSLKLIRKHCVSNFM